MAWIRKSWNQNKKPIQIFKNIENWKVSFLYILQTPLYFENAFIFCKTLYILHFSFLALRLIIIVDEAEVWDIDSAKLLPNM